MARTKKSTAESKRTGRTVARVVLSRKSDDLREYHGSNGDYVVRRVLVRTAYPKSGNAYNPTPEYVWVVTRDGRPMGSETRLSGARALIADCEEG